MPTKHLATVNGAECEFLSEAQGPAIWHITVGERRFTVDLHPAGPGRFSAIVDGRCYDLEVRRERGETIVSARQGRLRIVLGNHRDPRALQAAHGHGGPAQVTAMMPGRVVEVQVAVGDQVSAGQPLLVIEAMKMENDVTAPRDGRVREVRVSAQDTVEHGQVLIVIE